MATYVLLHGAYQGGWIWQRVTPHLRAAGHSVFTPTLDGCAERRQALRPGIDTESQAEEVSKMLFFEDLRDIVLVGTSCGWHGRRPRGGNHPRADRTDRSGRRFSTVRWGEIADHVKRSGAVTDALSTGPTPEDAANRMFISLDEPTKEWALARYTPHPVAAMTAPVRLDHFWQQDWNASVIWCRRSINPPVAHQKRAAETLHAKWYELDTGHYPMLTEPRHWRN